jgi:hypothetical protein
MFPYERDFIGLLIGRPVDIELATILLGRLTGAMAIGPTSWNIGLGPFHGHGGTKSG